MLKHICAVRRFSRLCDGAARLALVGVLFFLLLAALPALAAKEVPVSPSQAAMPMLPYLDWMLDPTGALTAEDMPRMEQQGAFRPLDIKSLPRENGAVWLRFTMAPRPAEVRPPTLLLDLGEDIPETPVLYVPRHNVLTGGTEWQSFTPSQRSIFLMPEARTETQTGYVRLDGLPGLWFAPMLRTPHNAATALERLARPGLIVALGVIMLLCLLRGLTERGEWRIWTSAYTGVALLNTVWGIPAQSSLKPLTVAALLVPGLAVMLLPHVGRHLMRTRALSRAIDVQLLLLCLPGAALALLPFIPGFSWTTRYLELWPVCTLLLVPTTLGAWLCGLPGARRFLLGCLLPPLGVAAAWLSMGTQLPAALLVTAPLWGVALGALIIAGTATAREDADGSGKIVTVGPALVDEDPNLRIVSSDQPEGEAAFAEIPVAPGDPTFRPDATMLAMEEALRAPMDALLRDGIALEQCSLPPLARQLCESMLGTVRSMSDTLTTPLPERNAATRSSQSVELEKRIFDLQEVLREAHNSVSNVADSKNIALSWFMPPHLPPYYLGDAAYLEQVLRMLLESAVRATSRGAVQISVRRVPESIDPGHLLFAVTDTGAGMPPEDRSSMALVRAWELAAAYHGFLGVECSPMGASISFTLHLDAASAEDGADVEQERGHGVPSVIIAEGSSGNRQLLAYFLEGLPCTVIETRNADEAVSLQKEHPASLIIFDADMPGDLAAAVRDIRQHETAHGLAPAMIMALAADDDQWEALTAAGFTHVLPKPVTRAGLREAVAQLLREREEAATRPASPLSGETFVSSEAPPAAEQKPDTAPEPLTLTSAAVQHPFSDHADDDDWFTAPQTADTREAPAPAVSPHVQPSAERDPFANHDDDWFAAPWSEEAATASVTSPATESRPDAAPETGPGAEPAHTERQFDDDDDDNWFDTPRIEGTAAKPTPPPAAAPGPEPVPHTPLSMASTPASSVKDAAASSASSSPALHAVTSRPDATTPEPLRMDAAPAGRPFDDAPLEMTPGATEPTPTSSPFLIFEDDDDIIDTGIPLPDVRIDEPKPPQAKTSLAGKLELSPLRMGITAADATQPARPEPTIDESMRPKATHLDSLPEPPVFDEPLRMDPATPPARAEEDAPAVSKLKGVLPLPDLFPPDMPLPSPRNGATPRAEAAAEPMPPVDKTNAAYLTSLLTDAEGAEEPASTAPEGVAATATAEADEAPAPVTVMRGRITLTPPARPTPAPTPLPAPQVKPEATAQQAAAATTPEHEEWVGEAVPVGTPLAKPETPAAATPKASPTITVSDRISVQPSSLRPSTSAPRAGYEGPYVSPRSGEWVGEPQPVPRKPTPDATPIASDGPGTAAPLEVTAPSLKAVAPVEDARPPQVSVQTPPSVARVPERPEAGEQIAEDRGFVPLSFDPPAAERDERIVRPSLLPKSPPLLDFIIGGKKAEASNGADPAPKAPPAPPKPAPAAAAAAAPSGRPPAAGSGSAPRATYANVGEPTPVSRPQPAADTGMPLEDLLEDFDVTTIRARQAFERGDTDAVHTAAGRLAYKADSYGLRALARMARCVADAARAKDKEALGNLLPELELFVERNRIAMSRR